MDIKVIPSTAVGNVMMQAKWAGVVQTITEMRQMIRESLADGKRYEPQDSDVWNAAYEKYLKIQEESSKRMRNRMERPGGKHRGAHMNME